MSESMDDVVPDLTSFRREFGSRRVQGEVSLFTRDPWDRHVDPPSPRLLLEYARWSGAVVRTPPRNERRWWQWRLRRRDLEEAVRWWSSEVSNLMCDQMHLAVYVLALQRTSSEVLESSDENRDGRVERLRKMLPVALESTHDGGA